MEDIEQSQPRQEATSVLEAREQAGYWIQPESMDDLIVWEAESIWPGDDFRYSTETGIELQPTRVPQSKN